MTVTLKERIDAVLAEARKVEEEPPRDRFSNAAECVRKHVYERRAFQEGKWQAVRERYVRWNVAAACGTAIAELVLEPAAKRLGADTQVPATLETATGHADTAWNSEHDDVWDWKCCGEFEWWKVQARPDPKHVLQIQGYARALGKRRWVLVYLRLGTIGKGQTMDWLAHDGAADPAIAGQIGEHWREVSAHVDAKTLPPRPYEKREWECENACAYAQDCWRDANG